MNNMIFLIEAAMLALMFLICIQASITDLKRGIVQNKMLLFGSILSIVLNSVYYIIFAFEYTQAFLINFGFMTVLSLLFYGMHIWAAGDSKLLIFVVSLIPARIYYSGNNVVATVSILISIFSIAFLFYVFESIYIGIRERNLFSISRIKIDAYRMVIQYLKCTCIITLVNYIISLIMPSFYFNNIEMFMIIDMIIVFSVCNIRVFNERFVILALVCSTVAIIIIQGRKFEFVNWAVYGIIGIVLFMRILAEKYNYKTIFTEEVKPGMILSYGTVMLFHLSKIKGLPQNTTEDIRSRISEDEANSIIRWKNSKHGQESIIIVRKIPFAIFITIGTIFYLLTRILF